MTEENSHSAHKLQEDSSTGPIGESGRESAGPVAKLRAYQDREEAMQKQIDDLLKEREADQAQILV